MITTGCQTITFTDQVTLASCTITIPPGNYPYRHLAPLITSLVTSLPPCTCTYSADCNTFKFAFSNATQVTFDGVATVLGFPASITGTTMTGGVAQCEVPIPYICFCVTNVEADEGCTNLDNAKGSIETAHTIAIIPITANPFTVNEYVAPTDPMRHQIAQYKLSALHIELRDMDGNALSQLPDHTFALKVTTIEVVDEQAEDGVRMLSELNSTVSNLFMNQYLKHN
jgi:hypothetical protein